MTKIRQDKRARPAAVELHDDALDRAAGGAEPITFTATVKPTDGSVRTINADIAPRS